MWIKSRLIQRLTMANGDTNTTTLELPALEETSQRGLLVSYGGVLRSVVVVVVVSERMIRKWHALCSMTRHTQHATNTDYPSEFGGKIPRTRLLWPRQEVTCTNWNSQNTRQFLVAQKMIPEHDSNKILIAPTAGSFVWRSFPRTHDRDRYASS